VNRPKVQTVPRMGGKVFKGKKEGRTERIQPIRKDGNSQKKQGTAGGGKRPEKRPTRLPGARISRACGNLKRLRSKVFEGEGPSHLSASGKSGTNITILIDEEKREKRTGCSLGNWVAAGKRWCETKRENGTERIEWKS